VRLISQYCQQYADRVDAKTELIPPSKLQKIGPLGMFQNLMLLTTDGFDPTYPLASQNSG
jgi:hypothetical protein